ncbi:MAG: glycoside hydrolase family 127 protein [Thermomicrobiales bacterium]|nr:glycoside hydrolase family 127 protein [Thermomicrobiales bacterium]
MTATLTRTPVVDTAHSPHALLQPVPVSAVTIEDRFWAPRRERNRAVTLPAQYRMLWETGRFDNFLRVAGKHDGPFQGRYFNDSDVYKWLEAASWALASDDDPELRRMIDEAIPIIAGAQRADGYLDTYFELECADKRWTNHDLHEMYCAGHLFQAAVAHHRVTGSRQLLEIAVRVADHIDSVFGPAEQGKRAGTDGHPEAEMGLVELYRETGERRYLTLAQFLLDTRGHGLLGSAYGRFGSAYHQDHQPFREMAEIVGHAVRAVYYNAGAADIFSETGETALSEALHRLWANMTERKMYVSGGIGSRYHGEAFGEEYELPNRLAYTETCAAIGSAMWSWRMLLIEGDARYADLIELQLVNAMLAGVSLDGETYFYQNPLSDEGQHRRSEWFYVACCPPNVARTLASLPGYLYAVKDDEIWVHQYVAGQATIPLADGRTVELRQETAYPWDGEIAIVVETAGVFALKMRVPGWSHDATLAVNGEPLPYDLTPGSYVEIRRDWRSGDVVALALPMPVRRVESHPYVTENSGRIALMRGPLLYCVEQADNPEIELRELALADSAELSAMYEPDLLGGVVTLSGQFQLRSAARPWVGTLYRETGTPASTAAVPVTVIAIPYLAWANREPGRMRVWIPRA